MSLSGAKLICLNEKGERGKNIPAKGRKFTIGYYMSCDHVLEHPDAKNVHCEINCDAFGRVTIHNMSDEHPISLNDKPVTIKRPLLNGNIVTILGKNYLWDFPKVTSSEVEELNSETPPKHVGGPEQPPNSCPDLKLHRHIQKRLTVHNFTYCIQSDDEGNTSLSLPSDSSDNSSVTVDNIENPLPTSNKTEQEERSTTPEPIQNQTTLLLNREDTPNINTKNCTKNNDISNTTGKKKNLLSFCQSDVVITSFSPRETGVRIEKSFTAIFKPTASRSVYSTPRGGLRGTQDGDGSLDFIPFSTPATIKKISSNSSMHLIDLTTPGKIKLNTVACSSPKSTVKPTFKKNLIKLENVTLHESGITPLGTPVVGDVVKRIDTPDSVISVNSTDSSSVVEISDSSTSCTTEPAATASATVTVNSTPKKVVSHKALTPKRTPHSLMKRALLTSAKKQGITPIRTSASVSRSSAIATPDQSDISTPSASPRNIQFMAQRHSMSTPARRTGAMSRLKLDGSPTSASSASQARRSSICPLTGGKPTTSTPFGRSYLLQRSALKTSSNLHKVRKSIPGTPGTSNVSKVRKSLALSMTTAASSATTSSSGKSGYVKSAYIPSPASVRARAIAASIIKDPQLTKKITTEPKKAVLFCDKPIEEVADETSDLNRTFTLNDSDIEIKKEALDTTFSPIKEASTISDNTTPKVDGNLNVTFSPEKSFLEDVIGKSSADSVSLAHTELQDKKATKELCTDNQRNEAKYQSGETENKSLIAMGNVSLPEAGDTQQSEETSTSTCAITERNELNVNNKATAEETKEKGMEQENDDLLEQIEDVLNKSDEWRKHLEEATEQSKTPIDQDEEDDGLRKLSDEFDEELLDDRNKLEIQKLNEHKEQNISALVQDGQKTITDAQVPTKDDPKLNVEDLNTEVPNVDISFVLIDDSICEIVDDTSKYISILKDNDQENQENYVKCNIVDISDYEYGKEIKEVNDSKIAASTDIIKSPKNTKGNKTNELNITLNEVQPQNKQKPQQQQLDNHLRRTLNPEMLIETESDREFDPEKPSTSIDAKNSLNRLQFKTPKSFITSPHMGRKEQSCSTPLMDDSRDLSNTPTLSGTPIGRVSKFLIERGLLPNPENLDSSMMVNPDQTDDEGLDKFFRTPRAKDMMVLTSPESVHLKKGLDSVDLVHSEDYALDSTNLNLDDMFKTPVATRFSDYIDDLNDTDDAAAERKEGEDENLQNMTAEEVFDSLVGDSVTVTKTPDHKVYSSLRKVISKSPFSGAEIISDLPKSDIQEWVDSLENVDIPDMLDTSMIENDDPEISRDPLSVSTTVVSASESMNKMSVLGAPVSDADMSGIDILEDSLISEPMNDSEAHLEKVLEDEEVVVKENNPLPEDETEIKSQTESGTLNQNTTTEPTGVASDIGGDVKNRTIPPESDTNETSREKPSSSKNIRESLESQNELKMLGIYTDSTENKSLTVMDDVLSIQNVDKGRVKETLDLNKSSDALHPLECTESKDVTELLPDLASKTDDKILEISKDMTTNDALKEHTATSISNIDINSSTSSSVPLLDTLPKLPDIDQNTSNYDCINVVQISNRHILSKDEHTAEDHFENVTKEIGNSSKDPDTIAVSAVSIKVDNTYEQHDNDNKEDKIPQKNIPEADEEKEKKGDNKKSEIYKDIITVEADDPNSKQDDVPLTKANEMVEANKSNLDFDQSSQFDPVTQPSGVAAAYSKLSEDLLEQNIDESSNSSTCKAAIMTSDEESVSDVTNLPIKETSMDIFMESFEDSVPANVEEVTEKISSIQIDPNSSKPDGIDTEIVDVKSKTDVMPTEISDPIPNSKNNVEPIEAHQTDEVSETKPNTKSDVPFESSDNIPKTNPISETEIRASVETEQEEDSIHETDRDNGTEENETDLSKQGLLKDNQQQFTGDYDETHSNNSVHKSKQTPTQINVIEELNISDKENSTIIPNASELDNPEVKFINETAATQSSPSTSKHWNTVEHDKEADEGEIPRDDKETTSTARIEMDEEDDLKVEQQNDISKKGRGMEQVENVSSKVPDIQHLQTDKSDLEGTKVVEIPKAVKDEDENDHEPSEKVSENVDLPKEIKKGKSESPDENKLKEKPAKRKHVVHNKQLADEESEESSKEAPTRRCGRRINLIETQIVKNDTNAKKALEENIDELEETETKLEPKMRKNLTTQHEIESSVVFKETEKSVATVVASIQLENSKDILEVSTFMPKRLRGECNDMTESMVTLSYGEKNAAPQPTLTEVESHTEETQQLTVDEHSPDSLKTSRGRTRKPTARAQQFLQEERAKASTPKRKQLIASAEITTPQRSLNRRGRKMSSAETESTAGTTPQRSVKRELRGRRVDVIDTIPESNTELKQNTDESSALKEKKENKASAEKEEEDGMPLNRLPSNAASEELPDNSVTTELTQAVISVVPTPKTPIKRTRRGRKVLISETSERLDPEPLSNESTTAVDGKEKPTTESSFDIANGGDKPTQQLISSSTPLKSSARLRRKASTTDRGNVTATPKEPIKRGRPRKHVAEPSSESHSDIELGTAESAVLKADGKQLKEDVPQKVTGRRVRKAITKENGTKVSPSTQPPVKRGARGRKLVTEITSEPSHSEVEHYTTEESTVLEEDVRAKRARRRAPKNVTEKLTESCAGDDDDCNKSHAVDTQKMPARRGRKVSTNDKDTAATSTPHKDPPIKRAGRHRQVAIEKEVVTEPPKPEQINNVNETVALLKDESKNTKTRMRTRKNTTDYPQEIGDDVADEPVKKKATHTAVAKTGPVNTAAPLKKRGRKAPTTIVEQHMEEIVELSSDPEQEGPETTRSRRGAVKIKLQPDSEPQQRSTSASSIQEQTDNEPDTERKEQKPKSTRSRRGGGKKNLEKQNNNEESQRTTTVSADLQKHVDNVPEAVGKEEKPKDTRSRRRGGGKDKLQEIEKPQKQQYNVTSASVIESHTDDDDDDDEDREKIDENILEIRDKNGKTITSTAATGTAAIKRGAPKTETTSAETNNSPTRKYGRRNPATTAADDAAMPTRSGARTRKVTFESPAVSDPAKAETSKRVTRTTRRK